MGVVLSWRWSPVLACSALLVASLGAASVVSDDDDSTVVPDWLLSAPGVAPPGTEARVVTDACWTDYGGDAPVCGVELTNGLLSRRFVTAPAFGTVDLILRAPAAINGGGSRSLFRATAPEASINASGTLYAVGALASNSTFRAYCNRTEFFAALVEDSAPTTLRWTGALRVSEPKAPFAWTPGARHSPATLQWPPAGVTLEVDFAVTMPSQEAAAEGVANLEATVFYELYDGVPLMTKRLELRWGSPPETTTKGRDEAKKTSPPDTERATLQLNAVTTEQIAANAGAGAFLSHGSKVPGDWGDDGTAASTPGSAPGTAIFAKTDQAYGAACSWLDDWPNSMDPVEDCPTCRDEGAVEPLLACAAEPGIRLEANATFASFRAIVLGIDAPTDLVRATLMKHAATRLLAPWTTENPIFYHYAPADDTDDAYETAVRQMADVGFELFIFSFGNDDFVMETTNATYLKHIKGRVDYARSYGIEVGGYDLIVLDRGHGGYGGNVGDQWTAVNADGSLSENACFASGWTDVLFDDIFGFINATGLTNLETDGPYGGGSCAATNHSHHDGLEDSVYQQTYYQSLFYSRCRELGIYVNQPDEFFYVGGNRAPMGYSEEQYSLPTWRDLTVSRAGMYDDLYSRSPTQGWMFVPITPYEGGGAAAEFDDKVLAFEWALAQYLGAGVAAAYRGSEKTPRGRNRRHPGSIVLLRCRPYLWNNATAAGRAIRGLLVKWVAFFNAYRETLIAPVVHLRRPDGQSWDGWLHVNPGTTTTPEVGVALVFNPTDRPLSIPLRLPLYYCGLDDAARITVDGNQTQIVTLNRDYTASIVLDAPPMSVHTLVVHPPGGPRPTALADAPAVRAGRVRGW